MFITCILQLLHSLLNLNKISLINDEIIIANTFIKKRQVFKLSEITSFNRVNGSDGIRAMYLKSFNNKKFNFNTSELIGLDEILDHLIGRLRIDSNLSNHSFLEISSWLTGFSAVGFIIYRIL